MTFDWPTIQLRYIRGESAYKIADSIENGPTRQGITKRAKKEGWAQLPTVADKHLTMSLENLGNDTPSNRQRVLEILSEGATYSLASNAIGVSSDTLLAWRKADPTFSAQCKAAKAQMLADCAATIYRAKDKDWKAGKYLLETAQETRKDFNTQQGDTGKVNITFNIRHSDAEQVIIEGETV